MVHKWSRSLIMGDLTDNLSRHEFACKCGCGFDTVDIGLAPILQEAADYFLLKAMLVRADVVRVFVTINSGCRCEVWNKLKGGSENSRHMEGRAADFKIKLVLKNGTKEQIHPDKVAAYLDKRFKYEYGIGWYNGRTHFDNSSSGRRRWDKR